MRSLATALLLALLLVSPGSGSTWLASADIHRPLVPQRIPDREALHRLFPKLGQREAGKARRRVVVGWYFFDVTRIDDWSDWLWISSLLRARRLNPADPYAPCLLGAYFAAHHELAAARDATRESLLLLRALEDEVGVVHEAEAPDPVLKDLEDLHRRCGINLARYRFLLGDGEGALDELAELPSIASSGSPLVEKAFWWLSTLALLEVGETAAGKEALREAREVDSNAILHEAPRSSPLREEAEDYPQYFAHASAVESYLEASILWREGKHAEALKASREAVHRWPRLYDAQLSRGLILADNGQVKQAVSVLEELRQTGSRGKMMRPEVIAYNLARVRAEQNDLGAAERLYKDAIHLVETRNCNYFREFAGYAKSDPACNAEAICQRLNEDRQGGEADGCRLHCEWFRRKEAGSVPETASAGWLCESLHGDEFVAARNNLGVLYLQRAQEEHAAKGWRRRVPLRVAWSQDEEKFYWLHKALLHFEHAKHALQGTELETGEMWHRVNLNEARAHLARAESVGFLKNLKDGLAKKDPPRFAYLDLLKEGEVDTRRPDAARLYLDLVESLWGTERGQSLPQFSAQLAVIVKTCDGIPGDAVAAGLAERARRLLGAESASAKK